MELTKDEYIGLKHKVDTRQSLDATDVYRLLYVHYLDKNQAYYSGRNQIDNFSTFIKCFQQWVSIPVVEVGTNNQPNLNTMRREDLQTSLNKTLTYFNNKFGL